MFGSALWIVNFFVAGCLLLPYPSLLTAAHYHEPQTPYQAWYRPRLLPLPPRRAVDLMSDIINELGIRILQQYVENGNVAFSPAGLGFILAALYEGSSSRTRQQIIDSLGMPRDKTSVRIGMRDIHRRLRTYLNPDGFLGGLNLNRENTSLRPEYENILRFYGFDLTIDLSDFTANNTSNFGLRGSTPANSSATTSAMQTTTSMPSSAMNETISADGTTMQPNADTTVATDSETTTAIMTTLPPQVGNASQSDLPMSTMNSSTMEMNSTTTSSTMGMNSTMASSMMSMNTTTTVMQSPTTLPATTMSNNATMTPTMMPANSTTTATSAADTMTAAPNVVRRRRNNRRRRSNDAYFSTIPDDGLWMQDLGFWTEQVTLPSNIRDSVDLQFLVNGCELVNVPAATYTAVLPFAYFPSLKAAVLEFPLDNPRYNVMLLLPTERVDTARLARELSSHSLRLLRKRLRATWVHATIPSFMLRGFVTLTPYLQRLGIKDVFEPRLADLSPMTPDLGVYARDVQQSIAVNIRNYMREDSSAGNGNCTTSGGGNGANLRDLVQEEPSLILPLRPNDYRFQRPDDGLLDRIGFVSFKVDHPFLFFIVDDETSASLIAGRIDDPQNSRIL